MRNDVSDLESSTGRIYNILVFFNSHFYFVIVVIIFFYVLVESKNFFGL